MKYTKLNEEIILIEKFKELYSKYLSLNKSTDLRYLSFMNDFFYFDSYSSCKIENNSYSLEDSFILLININRKEEFLALPQEGSAKNNTIKNIEDIINSVSIKYPFLDTLELEDYFNSIKYIFNTYKSNYPLSSSYIKYIHSLLLKDLQGNGEYKIFPNVITDGINEIDTVPPHQVEYKIELLIKNINKEIDRVNSNLDKYSLNNNLNDENIIDYFRFLARIHAHYEHIHPFMDGNGKSGRLLLHYINLNLNYLPFTINVNNRIHYYSTLNYFNKTVNYIEYPEDKLALFFLKEYIDNLILLLDPDNSLFEV